MLQALSTQKLINLWTFLSLTLLTEEVTAFLVSSMCPCVFLSLLMMNHISAQQSDPPCVLPCFVLFVCLFSCPNEGIEEFPSNYGSIQVFVCNNK